MDRKNILDRLMMSADLPGEATPGMPLVEIMGEHRVLIENHKGVSGYGKTEICVKVKFGVVKVTGCRLALARMSGNQLVITGHIDGVNLCRR
ncbi:MAG: YabP/YqfC family sporulation protein [Oscillospiraceae bacterium]|nr:YabP/YqfC family sporulation protein [Oscillospiraceae bacterium]